MHTLTIGAASLASARGFLDNLRGFQTELVETAPDTYEVRISLRSRDEIHQALRAIDDHVTARAAGPARLDLDGSRYLLEPLPDGAA